MLKKRSSFLAVVIAILLVFSFSFPVMGDEGGSDAVAQMSEDETGLEDSGVLDSEEVLNVINNAEDDENTEDAGNTEDDGNTGNVEDAGNTVTTDSTDITNTVDNTGNSENDTNTNTEADAEEDATKSELEADTPDNQSADTLKEELEPNSQPYQQNEQVNVINLADLEPITTSIQIRSQNIAAGNDVMIDVNTILAEGIQCANIKKFAIELTNNYGVINSEDVVVFVGSEQIQFDYNDQTAHGYWSPSEPILLNDGGSTEAVNSFTFKFKQGGKYKLNIYVDDLEFQVKQTAVQEIAPPIDEPTDKGTPNAGEDQSIPESNAITEENNSEIDDPGTTENENLGNQEDSNSDQEINSDQNSDYDSDNNSGQDEVSGTVEDAEPEK